MDYRERLLEIVRVGDNTVFRLSDGNPCPGYVFETARRHWARNRPTCIPQWCRWGWNRGESKTEIAAYHPGRQTSYINGIVDQATTAHFAATRPVPKCTRVRAPVSRSNAHTRHSRCHTHKMWLLNNSCAASSSYVKCVGVCVSPFFRTKSYPRYYYYTTATFSEHRAPSELMKVTRKRRDQ